MPEFDDFVTGSTELTTPAVDDLFPVVDTSAGSTKKVQGTNRLMPLGKLQQASPRGGILFDPNSTLYDDAGWTYLAWNNTYAIQAWGFDEEDTGGAITVDVDQVFANLKVESLAHGNGRVLGTVGTYTQVQARAQTGQTEDLLQLTDDASSPTFAVNQQGAINKLNGVTVPITGVAVNIASVHAALIALGLITT